MVTLAAPLTLGCAAMFSWVLARLARAPGAITDQTAETLHQEPGAGEID